MAKALAQQALVGSRAKRPRRAWLGRAIAWVNVWITLWAERRALRSLDPHLLQDIGLDQESADHEGRRHFWDVPPQRRPSQ